MYMCDLPESTRPSQNIPPFQQMYMCDPPRIYPSLPEYTPLSTNIYVRPSQNIPFPPRIYLRFQQLCDPPRIHPHFQQLNATFSKSNPPSQNTPPFFNNYIIMRRSHNIFLPPRIYLPFNNYMPHSQKLSLLFLDTTCNCKRIYNSLSELKNILGGRADSVRVV